MPKLSRLILIALLLPFLALAQTKPKILIVPPQSIALNKNSVSAMRSSNIKPDSLVAIARKVFVTNAATSLSDYTVKVMANDDSAIGIKPTPIERTATIQVKRRNFITRREKLKNKIVKYKGTTIGTDEKLKLDWEKTTFDYDYVVVISFFEIADTRSMNLALKPLSRFAVHYEIYDKNLVFKTGNVIADDFVVSNGIAPSVLFHYLTLSAQNVYLAVATGLR